MKKKFYYIEERKIKSDFINSEEYPSKEEAENHFRWLKMVEINAKPSQTKKVYSLIEWETEIDEDGEPLENCDGIFNEIDSFETNKIL